jgi:hypothetical protein
MTVPLNRVASEDFAALERVAETIAPALPEDALAAPAWTIDNAHDRSRCMRSAKRSDDPRDRTRVLIGISRLPLT